MKKIEAKGSYYEIGLQLGKALEKDKSYPPKFTEEVLKKSLVYEEIAKKYAPDLLDEFKGITDHLGIDYYVPITLELTPHRFETSCLVFAISGEHTTSGNPILARSHEWKEEESENLRLCYIEPEGKLKSMGFTFSWPLVSRYGGINEAGVALASASSSFENNGPGIILNIATRWILDNCRTTKEAVTFLEKIPKVWGETYVIVDNENTIAKVESHAKKTNVTYPESGFTFNSLHYDSPEMQDFVTKEDREFFKVPFNKRMVFMDNWFEKNKGQIVDSLIQEALKSHEHDMCYHGPVGLEICWSYLLKPTEKKALVCAGRPCKNEFKEFHTY
ncbi:MAG: hypothetical protein HGN29_16000 [Asgard group archaeon]|nr:hypothetical protein [Asgard group archaeon]